MKTLLVVEDDQDIFELVRSIFRGNADLQVRHAGTLAAARAELTDHPPDVILLDFALPDGPGPTLLPSIPGRVPVVAMTGSAALAHEEGRFVSYLSKPFKLEDLRWLIDSALRTREGKDPPTFGDPQA